MQSINPFHDSDLISVKHIKDGGISIGLAYKGDNHEIRKAIQDDYSRKLMTLIKYLALVQD